MAAGERVGHNRHVKRRQIEIFVLGSVLMGIGGAVLSTYTQLFDPGGYMPITHTFVVWVMALGGPFATLAFYRPLYGSLLLIAYSLVVAVINPPES